MCLRCVCEHVHVCIRTLVHRGCPNYYVYAIFIDSMKELLEWQIRLSGTNYCHTLMAIYYLFCAWPYFLHIPQVDIYNLFNNNHKGVE